MRNNIIVINEWKMIALDDYGFFCQAGWCVGQRQWIQAVPAAAGSAEDRLSLVYECSLQKWAVGGTISMSSNRNQCCHTV